MKRKIIGAALLASIAGETAVPIRASDKSEELPALKARQAQLETELSSLRAQAASAPNELLTEQIQQYEANLEFTSSKITALELKARNEALEKALTLTRTKDAEDAVKEAVRRGAIKAGDLELQAKWKAKCVEDPENIAILGKMQGTPALDRGIAPQRIIINRAQVTRENLDVVLRAYAGERDPVEKAAIFARDIAPRIKEGDPLPLKAANTLGTLAGELVTQQTLELLRVELPELRAFATDFSSLGADYNQAIKSRIVGIPTSSDYNTTTGYAANDAVMVDVPVTIDEHKSVSIEFNANELASTSRKLFDEMAPAMAQRVALDLVAKALGRITAANYTNAPTVEAEIDFDRATVMKIAGALSDRGVPRNARTLLLTGAYYDRLFSDPAIVALAANQRQDLITGLRLLNIHDFDIIRTATLPNTDNLVGFGMSRSALVVAARVPNDYTQATNGAHGVVQTITNPASGFSVAYVEYVDHQLGRAVKRMAYMYGSAKGQINAGQRLASA